MNFYSPIWLYAGIAITLAAVAVLVAAARRRRKSLEIFASAKLAPELSKSYSPLKAGLKNAFFVAAIAAVCAALARPQYGYRWEESKSKGVDIIFAIDTSKSMLAEDITPNRLERAKLAVLDIVDMLKGDRIGIVAFSGQAFLQCPLTLDYDAFRMSLDALDTNVIQRGGTNIAAAIDEAQTAFEHTSARKILVLISDGEELEASAVERAKLAKDGGLTIYTLGVGGERGQAITITDEYGRTVKVKDENGKIVTSRLNEKVLAEVASAAGGFYGKLSPESAEKLFNSAIEPSQRSELSSRMKRLAIERFQIPLAVAIVLLALESLIGTRRFFGAGKGAFFLAALLAATLPREARAQDAPQQDQPPALQQQTAQNDAAPQPQSDGDSGEKAATQPPKPAQPPTAKELFNAGIDAFDKGEFAQSQSLFEAAMKLAPDDFPMHAKALYNMGNAEYKTAITPLLEASSASEVGAKLSQAQAAVGQTLAAADGVLKEGKPLLEKETQMLEAAKTDAEKQQAQKQSPLKNQQFQQKLSQVIAQCESLEKLPSQVREESAKSGAAWRKSAEIAENAEKFYADALSLSPDFPNAKANLETAKASAKKLSEQTAAFAQIEKGADAFEKRLKDIDIKKIVEELRKLVRNDDQQNQNNQNQQNQQQNQNQQNNQNNQQNQQNKSDNNKSDNKQNSENQQNKDNKNSPENKSEQNKQDKQNDQKDSGKQDKQNSENKNENKPEEKRDNSDNKNNGDQNKQPEKNKKDSPQNKDSAASPENKKDGNKEEQAVDNKRGENKPEAEQQQPAEAEREQAKKPEEKRQSGGGAEKSDTQQNAENFRKAEGVMTKFEAKQLLESMKDGEKILPLRGFGEQKQRFEKSYKDW